MNLKNHPKGRPGGGATSPPPEPPIEPPEPPPDLGVFVGFGKDTTGGTGGSTTTVSTWAQFKSAVQASGTRIVEIASGAGVINGLGEDITISNPNLTIDGTGWNKSFKRAGITIRTSNVIVTQMRLRPGDEVDNPDDVDALSILAPSDQSLISDIVIDRCSLLWGPDVTIAILNNVSDVTVQHCMIGAGLKQSAHFEAGTGSTHSYGMNISNTAAGDAANVQGKRITFYRNYIFHNWSGRNIRAMGTDNAEYVNNVVYNWKIALGQMNPTGANVVGNMFKKGPFAPSSNQVAKTTLSPLEPTARQNAVYWPTAGASANIGIGFTPSVSFAAGARRSSLYRPVDNGAAVLNLVTATSALADEIVDDAGPTFVDEVDQFLKDDWSNDTGDAWNGPGYPAPNPYWP